MRTAIRVALLTLAAWLFAALRPVAAEDQLDGSYVNWVGPITSVGNHYFKPGDTGTVTGAFGFQVRKIIVVNNTDNEARISLKGTSGLPPIPAAGSETVFIPSGGVVSFYAPPKGGGYQGLNVGVVNLGAGTGLYVLAVR